MAPAAMPGISKGRWTPDAEGRALLETIFQADNFPARPVRLQLAEALKVNQRQIQARLAPDAPPSLSLSPSPLLFHQRASARVPFRSAAQLLPPLRRYGFRTGGSGSSESRRGRERGRRARGQGASSAAAARGVR